MTPDLSGPGAACPVLVELVLLGRHRSGLLSYRFVSDHLGETQTPDERAVQLSGLTPAHQGAVCHSTSWRYADGIVVLTYAALPDVLSGSGQPMCELGIVSSADPLRPTPDKLHDHHVAAHAVRHLDFVAQTDRSSPAVGLTTRICGRRSRRRHATCGSGRTTRSTG